MMAKEFDVGDEGQVKEKQQKAQTRDKRIANGLAMVMAHPDSRLWLYSWFEEAGIGQDSFATNSSVTHYKLGQKTWFIRLDAILKTKPFRENYFKMLDENSGEDS